jgi:two-component system phosphate regulon sensor histidine kinase PhoR
VPKGVERLIYIVEDLDMITKFEVGDLNLDYSEFDIVELIQNVFDLLEMKAEKEYPAAFENYHIFTHYVRADRDRIQQVIENLIVELIKYGKTGGQPKLLW